MLNQSSKAYHLTLKYVNLVFGKWLHHKVLAIHVQPIHMLQCTTLQKAAQKPMVSFHRQGGLRYVAVCCQGQQQPGKSCQKSGRKSRAATEHTYPCCALMMRENTARSGLIGSILSMEVSACTTEGELPVNSDKLYEETPISQQPQDYMTAWTTSSTFLSAWGVLQNKLSVLICNK